MRFVERATPQTSDRPGPAASNHETPNLVAPQIPDDIRGLELDTRVAPAYAGPTKEAE